MPFCVLYYRHLTLKLLELQGTKGMEETREHMKDLNYFRLLLQGTCELIGKLFQYGEVTKNYVQNELHFDMCHLLLHHMCNCKIEDISVFKSVTRLLANSLCTVKPLAYKLWRSGILYILLHFICQRELPTPNHVIQYKYSLQVLLNLYYADNQMVIEDLSKLLPNPLVRRFVRIFWVSFFNRRIYEFCVKIPLKKGTDHLFVTNKKQIKPLDHHVLLPIERQL